MISVTMFSFLHQPEVKASSAVPRTGGLPDYQRGAAAAADQPERQQQEAAAASDRYQSSYLINDNEGWIYYDYKNLSDLVNLI